MRLLVSLLVFMWSCMTLSFSRCPAEVLVMYRMVLHTEWSEENFPKQYPEWRPPAQWSVVVGRSHNSSGVLWRIGKTASDSVKLFVETGKAELLVREGIEQKRGILSEFFAPPVTQGVGTTEATFFVDAAHSKVSMICRITPSPDWFIGVDSFDLCRANKWVDSVTLDLEPTDGGTDNGYTFTSPKWATDPRSNITPIRSRYPDHPASSFFYPELEKLPRIAWVSFLKMKEFFLSKQFTKNIKTESKIEEESISTSTRATIKSSPIGELKKYSLKQNPKLKKDIRKGLYPELGAFRSKGEATTKGKVRRTPKHLKNRPRSCRVSEWSDWSTCSKSCEIGEKTRKRKVIHFASRSGRPCPPLEETTWCRVAENCPNETAFFSWR